MIRQLPIHYCFPSRSVPSAAPSNYLSTASKQCYFPEVQSLAPPADIIFFPLAPLSLPHCSCSPGVYFSHWPLSHDRFCCDAAETALLPLFMPNQGLWNWQGCKRASFSWLHATRNEENQKALIQSHKLMRSRGRHKNRMNISWIWPMIQKLPSATLQKYSPPLNQILEGKPHASIWYDFNS